jgi:hypothetical protein
MKTPKTFAATAMLLLAQQVRAGDPASIRARTERVLEVRERLNKDRAKEAESAEIAATILPKNSPLKPLGLNAEDLRDEVRNQVRDVRSCLPSVRHELKQSIQDAKQTSREQARKLAEEAKLAARTARAAL